MRSTLPFIALASVLACGAWRAHAGATDLSFATGFPPVPAPTSPRKLDEYGPLRWSDEKARLDNYIIELRNDPTTRAYMVCYGGRRGLEGEARRRCARAANYLKKVGRVEAARVFTVDGGFREELTVELWAPPAGATLPTTSPTVDPDEVTIIKRGAARKTRRR